MPKLIVIGPHETAWCLSLASCLCILRVGSNPDPCIYRFNTKTIHIFSLLLAITKLSVDTAESIEAGKPLVENPGAGNWREKTGNTSERNPARDVFTIWWIIIISGEIPAPSGHQILVKCYHLWWILFRLLWKIQGLVTTWREKTGITSTKNPARNIFTILWKIITSYCLVFEPEEFQQQTSGVLYGRDVCAPCRQKGICRK